MKVYVSVDLPDDLAGRIKKYAEVVGKDRAEEADAVLCFNIDRELLLRMRRLKFIQVTTAGLDHLPWEDIPPNVTVAGNAGSNAAPVAEFAVALLLTAYKKILHYNAKMKGGDYSRDVEVPPLEGRKVAVLGLGEIGARVARALAALGASVYGFSRTPKEGPWRFTNKLEEALAGASAAVSALPLTKYTRGMIKYEHLTLMAEDAVFVNVGRAEVVDKEAVARILRERPRFVYASDVWWGRNDFGKDADIIGMPNVIATPWIAGGYGSAEIRRKMLEEAVENLIRWLRGDAPKNIARREDFV
ncbi:MAG: 2-hydroxyacid dehydrogenase [Thermoproteus sp. AZ2]|jgi:lactate dehydrogenase-like 2-hydroxyacid dehydrogenase|uniref:2-hydroxyacid dehydrogenase n=1 Tax=Thermoproteus sp. AZ2 TaxID=1609232 RepID=A0ACC6V060_9CREN|nr:MAG: 2-hydroxyacid dehydrogenase [Thermoproteus sp. AZ2]